MWCILLGSHFQYILVSNVYRSVSSDPFLVLDSVPEDSGSPSVSVPLIKVALHFSKAPLSVGFAVVIEYLS